MDLPKSIAPDDEDRLIEMLACDSEDLKDLEYIRRHMRYIYEEEKRRQSGENLPSSKIS